MNAAINGIRPDMGLQPAQIGMVQAMSLLGCVAGAALSGGVSLRFGRTRVIALAGAVIVIGEVLAVLSGSAGLGSGAALAVIVTGRLLVGVGIGGASAVVPAYVTEIGPSGMRGTLATMWEFSITIGQLIGLLSGFAISAAAGGENLAGPLGVHAWRWMFVVMAVLGAFYVVAGLLLPPSPADLVRHGRAAEAEALVARLGGDVPRAKIAELTASIEASRHAPGFASLRGPVLGLKRAVWVGIGVAVFQQVLGINAIKNYSNAVWQSVGVGSADSFGMSIVAAVVGLVATFTAVLIVRRVPARTLLIVGTCVMIPSHVVMAWAFAQADSSGALSQGAGMIALAAMMTYSVGFALSWGPCMWLLLTMIFDHGIRTVASAFCSTINWVTNWVVTLTFPLLAALSPAVPFAVYAVMGVFALVFLVFGLPARHEDLAHE